VKGFFAAFVLWCFGACQREGSKSAKQLGSWLFAGGVALLEHVLGVSVCILGGVRSEGSRGGGIVVLFLSGRRFGV
jgi:hypothetical protein